MANWSEEFLPAPCAEFPNDNPGLHEGAIWTHLSVGGTVRPVVRPKSLAPSPVTTETPPVPVSQPPLSFKRPIARGPILAPPRPEQVPGELRAKAPSMRPPRPPRPVVSRSPSPVAVPSSPPLVLEGARPLPEDVADVLALWLAPPSAAPRGAMTLSEPFPWTSDVADTIADWLQPAILRTEPASSAEAPVESEASSLDPLALAGFEVTPVPPFVLARAAAIRDDVLAALELSTLPGTVSEIGPTAPERERRAVGRRDDAAVEKDTAAHEDVGLRVANDVHADDGDEFGETTRTVDEVVTGATVESAVDGAHEVAVEAAVGTTDEMPRDAVDEAAVTEPAVDANGAAQPSEPSAYEAFASALVDVALTGGCTRAAAVLPGFLTGGRIGIEALDAALVERLERSGLAERRSAHVAATDETLATIDAWRGVLEGTSQDFSSCSSTLDDWAVDLLVAFGVPNDDLKRKLRSRGIAAFGMLQAA